MENDEEEEDKIVGQVLDEIGIDMSEGIPNAPEIGLGTGASRRPLNANGGKVAVGEGVGGHNGGNGGIDGGNVGGGAGDTALLDLEARLNNLKR
jgi:charged multivesicular body protein 2A